MLKYRGTYRVIFEAGKRIDKACEFSYIPCRIRKSANICRQNGNTLNVYIPGIKTVNRLLKKYSGIFKAYQIGDAEATLLFPEEMIQEAAVILKARVLGKNMNPKPKRKLNLTQEQKEAIMVRLTAGHKKSEMGALMYW